ncbi:hypothetical protein ACU8KH_03153 [Lachancea thermotolerans]
MTTETKPCEYLKECGWKGALLEKAFQYGNVTSRFLSFYKWLVRIKVVKCCDQQKRKFKNQTQYGKKRLVGTRSATPAPWRSEK